jgi:hypothetical protein
MMMAIQESLRPEYRERRCKNRERKEMRRVCQYQQSKLGIKQTKYIRTYIYIKS